MNIDDVLKYGHRTVMMTIDGLNEAQCSVAGVCGYWSVREIMAHLASHELILNDVLASFLDPNAPTPTLNSLNEQGGGAFNDIEVDKRKGLSYAEIVEEYVANATRSRELAIRVPLEKRRQVGLLPWYGMEYDLEDLVAYSNYGHKREHTAQINVYKDTLK